MDRGRNIKLQKQMVVTGLLFLILVICWKDINLGFGDDLVYKKVWEEKLLVDFLQSRYNWWSSRVVIEAVMMLLIAAKPCVWWILNIGMVIVLVKITADLFGGDNKLQAQLIFFAIMWIVPIDTINGTGWIATTLNYLWPLALGLVAMRPLKHWFKNENCARWEYIICPLCVLFASNAEQMAAILIGVYLLSGVFLVIYKKRIPLFFMVQLLLIIASLYFTMRSPGNRNRYYQEMARYFPEFGELGVGSKLLLGFLVNAQYYIGGGYDKSCYLFACLAGVLFLCFLTRELHKTDHSMAREKIPYDRWKRKIKFMVAVCPLLAYCMCAHFFHFLIYKANVPRLRNLFAVFSENRELPIRSVYPAYIIILQMIFYLAVFVCVFLVIYFLHGRTHETIFELLILCIGYASRMIMGFSPTIYASGSRTAIFCSMAVLIVLMRNIQLWLEKGQKVCWKIVMGTCVCMGILCNIV